jgi:glycosyltransferase involved in cell wall biosynthesis
MSETRIVNVASYNRIESLVKSLESIIDQCDVINVTLNSHDGDIPEILYHDKINLILSDNSLGDAMKFYMLDKSDGYFLTIDDDLIYPPNYVEFMIAKCKEYGNTRVMTLHGRNFASFPITSYYRSATEIYACLNTVKKNVIVQFGGTGVMCFHTDLFKLGIDYFMTPNMADVWIGRYCLDNKIDILCLRHEKGYIKYIPQKTTIYDQESNNDGLQTEIANAIYQHKPLPNILNIPRERSIPIVNKLEKTPSTINYDKVNQIFNGQTHVGKTRQQNNNINERPTGNAQMIQKLMGKRRGR